MVRKAILATLAAAAVVAGVVTGIFVLPAANAGTRCTNPSTVFHGQGSKGFGDYYADADMWNAGGHDITQTMGVCSHNSWYVEASASDHQDGAVLAYPNMHRDYHNWSNGSEPKISSFPAIQSSFEHTAPSSGVWDVAYDIWLNGVADKNSTELMIWTQNSGQRPAGSKHGTVSVSGHDWDLWASSDNKYVAFVAPKAVKSGTLDLKAFMKYLMDHGRLSTGSTLGQVDYGVEIVSTGGSKQRFDFTDFSVGTSRTAASSVASTPTHTAPSATPTAPAHSKRAVVAAGRVSVTPQAKKATSLHVSFPAGRFGKAPVVTTTPMTSVPSRVSTSVDHVTRSGFVLHVYSTDATKATVGWTAIQP
ncbi:MAG TPA: hypothetical protein VF053_12410 [Streptosporangiales bacterium]